MMDTTKASAAVLLSLLFTFASRQTYAFFDPPWITPAMPRAGETVSVNIHGGICDAIIEWPGYPQITKSGDSIRIVEYGDHVTFDDFCIYGIGTLTEPLGEFAAGDYTLTVDFIYDDLLFGPTTITLGIIPFTVAGALPPAPVPTSNPSSLFALLLGISTLGLYSLYIRRRAGSALWD